MKIVIDEISISLIKPKNGLVCFASCILNRSLYLGCIAVYTTLSHSSGYRLVYPNKVATNKGVLPCFYPINQELGNELRNAIVEKLEEVMTKLANDYDKQPLQST